MATIAVFIALGGASYAALKLPKNSVGTKQLKKNAVTTKNIKKNAVTGVKVQEATLATVPSATQAERADSAGNADALGGLGAERYVTSPTEPVHLVGTEGNPPFKSTFKNFGSNFAPAGFYRDQFGIVHLQGVVDPPGFAGTIFTLPEGYLPAQSYNFTYFGAMADSEKTVPIQLEADGDVVAATSNYSTSLSLDGITFRAES
jgi:hypothetical protein